MRPATRAAVRRITLVALLTLAAQALLPYLHANALETDCTVCVALAHGGARAVDAPAPLAPEPVPVAVAPAAPAPSVSAPSVDRDTAGARAPPASLLA